MPEHGSTETGCAYLLEIANGRRRRCDAARRPGSSYCAPHHVLCHIAAGSAAEARQLREIEALADAVGGRQTLGKNRPPERFLERLEQRARLFL